MSCGVGGRLGSALKRQKDKKKKKKKTPKKPKTKFSLVVYFKQYQKIIGILEKIFKTLITRG